MATLTPTLAGIGQATIGGLPIAIVDLSVPGIAINDIISMSSDFQRLVNQALLDAGVVSVCSIVTSSQARFDELTFSSGATFDSGYTELSANQRIYETSNRAYERKYQFFFLSGSDWTYFAGSSPHQAASGYAVSMAYSVVFRVNGNYVGTIGASGSLSFYDSNASHNPNPFGNGTRSGVIIGLPSPSKTYAGVHTIQVNNLDVEIPDIEVKSSDPYEGAGASGPGGGDGTFDFSSTPINYPGLPTIGAYSTGFLNVYVPSAANLRSLAAYMWSGAFDIDNFRKLVADPMDAIMGLSIVPVTSTEIGVESTTLIVGNISTGISMPRALSQYVSVDCGEIEMPAKWGAYLDFSPYTKLQLYLPYIGFVDISPDDVMTANMGDEDDKMYPGTIGVQYHVDILSGSCIAFVKCRDHVIYEFGGQCACSCPVTEGQYKNGLLGMLEIISTVASTASAVAGGPGESASKANQRASKIGKVGAIAEGTLGVIDTSLAMIKPNITRSGSVGGSNGLMGYQIPYLVLTVPHMCIPGDQNVYIGYPSFVTLEMSELAGFTQIQITHLHNMSCTSDEADEIISLLSEGVIF